MSDNTATDGDNGDNGGDKRSHLIDQYPSSFAVNGMLNEKNHIRDVLISLIAPFYEPNLR